jgi:hypothetical protein
MGKLANPCTKAEIINIFSMAREIWAGCVKNVKN